MLVIDDWCRIVIIIIFDQIKAETSSGVIFHPATFNLITLACLDFNHNFIIAQTSSPLCVLMNIVITIWKMEL